MSKKEDKRQPYEPPSVVMSKEFWDVEIEKAAMHVVKGGLNRHAERSRRRVDDAELKIIDDSDEFSPENLLEPYNVSENLAAHSAKPVATDSMLDDFLQACVEDCVDSRYSGVVPPTERVLVNSTGTASDGFGDQAHIPARSEKIFYKPDGSWRSEGERETMSEQPFKNHILGVPYPDTRCAPWMDQVLTRLDAVLRDQAQLHGLLERAVQMAEAATKNARCMKEDLHSALETNAQMRIRIRKLELELAGMRETTIPRSGLKDIPDYSPKPKVYVQGEED